MIGLSPRLRAVKSLVKPGAVVADIGCDHGRLACALVQKGVASHVYASDAAEKPLENARRLIDFLGLSASVETVLTKGTTDLSLDLVDTVVVAGMGGDLIADIILSDVRTRDKRFDFILQPMSKPEKLRSELLENGFKIIKELAVFSDKRVYTVILTKYTQSSRATDDLTVWTGGLFDSLDAAARLYLGRTARRLEQMAAGCCAKGDSGEAARYKSIAADIRERLG